MKQEYTNIVSAASSFYEKPIEERNNATKTYPTGNDPMALAAMRMALMEMFAAKYMGPFEKILNNRAMQYSRLSEKNLFDMPEQEAQKHQNLCNRLAEELVVMDNVRWLVSEIIKERYTIPTPDDLAMLRHDYENAVRTVLALNEVVQSDQNALEYLTAFSISLMEENRRLKQEIPIQSRNA